ncbi:MAG TPA: polysaccharide deacetylase family protein [Sphingobacterium sp.]|nr:polysaccharide deacetylase family protein [Sphingobacterium sp.]
MKFVKPPFFLKWLYPQATYHRSRKERTIYLTFDDGPIPEITPWVLDILAQYNAKATFFCVGENISKHWDIFARIRREGHEIGNHTFNHLKGWDCDDLAYYENTAKCNELAHTRLFRPPYLRARHRQLTYLKQQYEIIFFDVLSYDFDSNTTTEQCYHNVMNNVKNGSIVVFHDNLKAEPRLRYTLPRVLEQLSQQGYSFSPL